ncbi:proline dehydrogenase family protein [Sporosarcina sp. resist]|uniref:proline dehydrogenase family protein n=1 Tax=Sporosarcina sp. resist TaxID=2762563 RepID=UPI00164E32D5|nr:proline dehydrogenase family protein [Sporosarcina sp. resist]QNK87774.1 proline dehydrogenase family protein [Sporosarcina sp. resist]
MSTEAERLSKALKSIARNEDIKAYIKNSKELYPLFMKAATRFVSGQTRTDGLARISRIAKMGYQVSIEYIGENTRSENECILAKNEFLELINVIGAEEMKSTVSFDLSHLGMSISDELAAKHLEEIAQQAQQYDIQLMISMEESEKTDQILNIYKTLSPMYTNLGITLQVHLLRSQSDLHELLKFQGKIRLVKGAYQEKEGTYIPRSVELDKRYVDFVMACVVSSHPLSIATHDEKLVTVLKEKGLLANSNTEIEMLDGVRPDLLKSLKDENLQTKVYVTYGTEWYLYLAHRIAEHPPNLYTFVSDMIESKSLQTSLYE